jgi:hypothetical protein
VLSNTGALLAQEGVEPIFCLMEQAFENRSTPHLKATQCLATGAASPSDKLRLVAHNQEPSAVTKGEICLVTETYRSCVAGCTRPQTGVEASLT